MPRKFCDRPWLVNYGFDPRLEGPAGEAIVYRSVTSSEIPTAPGAAGTSDEDGYPESADTRMVRMAVRRLDADEREIIERYYYMGQGFAVIAVDLEWDARKVERRHRQALRKLRHMLEPWVKNGDARALDDDCRICQSAQREAIDQVISAKPREESFRRVLRILRTRFGLNVRHPRVVIRHQQFHMSWREQ